jgi:pimeloyl-ACP methyl ester carboxylesterase
LLEARGHQALAPDLKGMGCDRTPLREVSLSLWSDQIADLIRAQTEPVVLLGHSRGGLVISEAAERTPQRIRQLVYLSAILLEDGETLIEGAGRDREAPGRFDGLEPGPDNTTTLAPSAAAERLYNTTEPYWRQRALAQLGPEPMAVFDTPIHVSEARFGEIPKTYIECSEDRAIPLTAQRAMHTRWSCKVHTLATDHSPFYSAPDALARLADEIAAG